jgi:hypothetical protein
LLPAFPQKVLLRRRRLRLRPLQPALPPAPERNMNFQYILEQKLRCSIGQIVQLFLKHNSRSQNVTNL